MLNKGIVSVAAITMVSLFAVQGVLRAGKGDVRSNTTPVLSGNGHEGMQGSAATSEKTDEATRRRVSETYGKLPLSFIRNDGQMDKQVRYYEKGAGHATYFTQKGVYLSLVGGRTSVPLVDKRHCLEQDDEAIFKPKMQNFNSKTQNSKLSTYNSQLATPQLVKLIPLGASKNPEIIAENQQEGKVNYLIGNDPAKWKTNIPTYQSVVYKEIYKGIDMKFYGNNRQMEYDIIVKPGANPSRVQLAYKGIEGLKVAENGDLEISFKEGKLIQKKPYVYQVIEGKKVEREGKFVIRDRKPSSVKGTRNTGTNNGHGKRCIYGFTVASYDKRYPLVIDPTIAYSTYLGGCYDDHGYGIAVDSAGNAYVTGFTSDSGSAGGNAGDFSNFPTKNPLVWWWVANGTTLDNFRMDAFVTKIDASGAGLSYSTYLGGTGDDRGYDIAVDSAGNAYVTGQTSSPDFPYVSWFDESLNNDGLDRSFSDAFVAKINAAGTSLSYSTYLGGGGDDIGRGIAIDSAGNMYVTGETRSYDFPTVNAIYGSYTGGCSAAFVTKINAAGTSLSYSTYLGGSGCKGPYVFGDLGYGIAVDSAGNAYVTGMTVSPDFPTVNAIYGSYNGGFSDAFVTKIVASGTSTSLSYSTYLGGSSEDRGYGIAVDSAGNAYVTGYTWSSDFPTANAIYGNRNTFFPPDDDLFFGGLNVFPDAFATKISIIQGSASTETGTNVVVQPVDSNTGETLANITFNEITQNGSTTISVYNSTEVAPLPPGFVVIADQQTYYEVDTTATFEGTATVCFNYPNDLSPEAEQNLKLFHYEDTNNPPDGTPDAWVDITASVDTVNNSICGITTSFSPFTVVKTETVTAITLLSFMAKAGDDGNVTLIWQTATEVNNAGFNIYRSRFKDGEYKKINDTLIPAQGDATSGASYSYEDTPPSKGTYFYKLEDVDFNGVSAMHGPEKVRVKK